MTAQSSVFVVYHLDSEQPRILVKDANNPDDPAWLEVNGETDGHAMMHMTPEVYNGLDQAGLKAHHSKYIPLHKAWHLKEGHRHKGDQRKAAVAFREHLKALGQ